VKHPNRFNDGASQQGFLLKGVEAFHVFMKHVRLCVYLVALGMIMGIDAAALAVYVPLVKDGIVTLAATVTAGVAIYGLRIWKRDLVGKEVYEAMKELVYQSHSISKAAARCLYPLMASEASVFTDEERLHTTELERLFLNESRAYRVRLETYAASFRDFSDSLMRARVLLGSKVSNAYQFYEVSLRQPMSLINEYLTVIDDRASTPHPQAPEIIRLRSRFIVAGTTKNEIVDSIFEAREKAEEFSLPYLHRKSIR
jgi:hypothetical protein